MIQNLVILNIFFSFGVFMLDCYCCQRLSQSQSDITCVIRFDSNLLDNLNVPTFKLHCNIWDKLFKKQLRLSEYKTGDTSKDKV